MPSGWIILHVEGFFIINGGVIRFQLMTPPFMSG